MFQGRKLETETAEAKMQLLEAESALKKIEKDLVICRFDLQKAEQSVKDANAKVLAAQLLIATIMESSFRIRL